jgi:hypothetical protein
LPLSIVPLSAMVRAATAPFLVAAMMACAGVIPSSTSPSMPMMVPMPWSWFCGFGVRDSSLAAAQ